MGTVINLTGQKFGKLTAIKQVENSKDGRAQWLCQCECGNQKIVVSKYLRNGHTKSCGCFNSLVGQKFGKLTVINATEKRDGIGSVIYNCLCDCGKYCFVSARCLRGNNTKSCGCLISVGENNIEKILKENNIIYISQYTRLEWRFPDSNYPGRFDFYLPDYNRLIEFDGSYHYEEKPIRSKNSWGLKKYQEHDQIKNQWAKNANIDLVRIPYWEEKSLNLDLLLGDKFLV